MRRSLVRHLERDMQRVDYLGRRVTHPGERIRNQQKHVAHLAARLARCAVHHLDQRAFRMRGIARRLAGAATDVGELRAYQQRLAERLIAAGVRANERHRSDLARLAAHLSALNPRLVLERGYAIVAAQDGSIVRDVGQLSEGDPVRLTLARGTAGARITDTRE
jgi:exodeoxyribonuclease VII large subunit